MRFLLFFLYIFIYFRLKDINNGIVYPPSPLPLLQFLHPPPLTPLLSSICNTTLEGGIDTTSCPNLYDVDSRFWLTEETKKYITIYFFNLKNLLIILKIYNLIIIIFFCSHLLLLLLLVSHVLGFFIIQSKSKFTYDPSFWCKGEAQSNLQVG